MLLITFEEMQKKYNMDIKGVIHIGAHYGVEVNQYIDSGIQNIMLFEPISRIFDVLQRNLSEANANIKAYQVALGSERGKAIMNLNTNNDGMSSSILTPKQHLIDHPWVTFGGTEEVEVDILDNYESEDYNFINIDVQGYELEVFKGAKKTLENIDFVYAEVNRAEVYEKNAMVEEIDEFLGEYNFKRVETYWPDTWYNWGDALYIKEKK